MPGLGPLVGPDKDGKYHYDLETGGLPSPTVVDLRGTADPKKVKEITEAMYGKPLEDRIKDGAKELVDELSTKVAVLCKAGEDPEQWEHWHGIKGEQYTFIYSEDRAKGWDFKFDDITKSHDFNDRTPITFGEALMDAVTFRMEIVYPDADISSGPSAVYSIDEILEMNKLIGWGEDFVTVVLPLSQAFDASSENVPKMRRGGPKSRKYAQDRAKFMAIPRQRLMEFTFFDRGSYATGTIPYFEKERGRTFFFSNKREVKTWSATDSQFVNYFTLYIRPEELDGTYSWIKRIPNAKVISL